MKGIVHDLDESVLLPSDVNLVLDFPQTCDVFFCKNAFALYALLSEG
jgi:hypothetical protein